MHLDDFARLDTATGRLRWGVPVPDVRGEETHFATIDGPEELVREVFGNSDFDITIVPDEGHADWERRIDGILAAHEENPQAASGVKSRGLFKPPPEPPTEATSVVMTLQRTRPAGTGYSIVTPFFVPRGVSLLFVLPPVCSAAGISIPSSGDPDLLLMLSPAGPTVDVSRFIGLATDAVSFTSPICLPFVGVIPFLNVFGFLTSTGLLIWSGVSFP
jgi:hypothetical protein